MSESKVAVYRNGQYLKSKPHGHIERSKARELVHSGQACWVNKATGILLQAGADE